jgi:hypothetical protein
MRCDEKIDFCFINCWEYVGTRDTLNVSMARVRTAESLFLILILQQQKMINELMAKLQDIKNH